MNRETLINELLDNMKPTNHDPPGLVTPGPIQAPGQSAIISSSPDRYRILRLEARGGLGEVFLAQDEQFSRTVALKRMRSPHDSDPVRRRRFLREAEITGKLDHPGIVPVHCLANDEHGSPCYAMKFVTGQTLEDAVKKAFASGEANAHDTLTGATMRDLVTRLISVCNTIAYAHSKGVIHRDIKPANIMLGEFGETYVVDWGLAKELSELEQVSDPAASPTPIELDEHLTRTGHVLGTPAFMSPEQACGNSSSLGVSGDIYSLGATLYYVLTGQAPVTETAGKSWLMQLQLAEFTRPGALRNNTPRGLEAICLKAIAREVKDRYQTALHLAIDLEKWLADEPVSAIDDSWSQRIARFTRRHRAWTQAMTVALMLLTVISVIFALKLDHQSTIATNEKQKALILASEKASLAEKEKAARGQAEQLLREKSELASLESQARKSADEQSKLALATLKSVVTSIQRKLVKVPGAQEIRRDLLTTAIEGLNKVATSLNTRTEADLHLFDAHFEIGKIFLLAGDVTGLKATEEALRHLTKANEIVARLANAQPADNVLQRKLSISFEWLGDVRLQKGELDSAEKAYQRSLDISEAMMQKNQGNKDVLRDVAFGYEKIGDIRLQRGMIAAARSSFTRSKEFYQQSLAGDSENPILLRDLMVSHSKLGDVLVRDQDFSGAAGAYRECLTICEKLKKIPQSNLQPRDRSVLFNKLGDALQHQNKLNEASSAFQSGLVIARANVNNDPTNVQSQRDLSISLNNVAEASALNGQVDQARGWYLESLLIRRKLAALDPTNFAVQVDLASVLARLGTLMKQAGQSAKSNEYYLEARNILQPLHEQKKLQVAEDIKLFQVILQALEPDKPKPE